MIAYTVETSPIGISLQNLDPETGKTWYSVIGKNMAHLCGCSVENLMAHGTPMPAALIQKEYQLVSGYLCRGIQA